MVNRWSRWFCSIFTRLARWSVFVGGRKGGAGRARGLLLVITPLAGCAGRTLTAGSHEDRCSEKNSLGEDPQVPQIPQRPQVPQRPAKTPGCALSLSESRSLERAREEGASLRPADGARGRIPNRIPGRPKTAKPPDKPQRRFSQLNRLHLTPTSPTANSCFASSPGSYHDLVLIRFKSNRMTPYGSLESDPL